MRNSLFRWRRLAVLLPVAGLLVPAALLSQPSAPPVRAASCPYTITGLSETSMVTGSGQFVLDVTLSSAIPGGSSPVVLFDGEFLPTDPDDPGMSLAAIVPGELLETARTLSVVVQCGDGDFTNAVSFEVIEGGPAVLGLLPDSAVAGSSWFILTVEGVGFSENSAITWNGTPLDTTYSDDPTKLIAAVPPSFVANRLPIATAEVGVITVGGTSGTEPASVPAVTFTILRSSSDVDCSGEADAGDALALLRAMAGLPTGPGACSLNADRSRDDLVNLADVMHVRQELAGVLPGGPVASLTQP